VVADLRRDAKMEMPFERDIEARPLYLPNWQDNQIVFTSRFGRITRSGE
jgi:hypothetical protein